LAASDARRAAVARWAASARAATLTLSEMPDNVAARGAYEGNGHGASHEPDDVLSDRRELVMLRDLGPQPTVRD